MAKVTVVFPIYFDTKDVGIDIDMKRIEKGDDDYMEEIRNAIKNRASDFLESGSCDPIITEAEIPELME